MREADEHIGFIRNFLKKRRLYRLIQAPPSDQKPDTPPSSPPSSPICSHASTSKMPGDDDFADFLSGDSHIAKEESGYKSDLEESDANIAALPVEDSQDALARANHIASASEPTRGLEIVTIA